MSFLENLIIVADKPLELEDVHDDLKLEIALAAEALKAAVKARKQILDTGAPFSRPAEYFGEMLKTQEHMSKAAIICSWKNDLRLNPIKKRLDDEKDAAKASEEARKQRQLKKFGKKVQIEKRLERERQKSSDLKKIAQLRKKHKPIEKADLVGQGDDGFDIQLEAEPEKKFHKSPARDKSRDSSKKRQYKDSKYGFGGKKRMLKKNTKESVNDTSDFSAKKNKQPFRGVSKKSFRSAGNKAPRTGKTSRGKGRK